MLLLAAGCGGKGTLGSKAVEKEAASLQSLAAEGGVLAGDAARGRSTSVFVRIHAQYLTKATRTSATVLAAGTTKSARALHALAQNVAHDLDVLSRSGSNRDEQLRLAATFSHAAKQAEQLGKSA